MTTALVRHAVGTCPQCGAGVGATAPGKVTCRECGHRVTAELVRGRYSDVGLCNDACMYARGNDCECQCAGANHALGYVVDVSGPIPDRIVIRDRQAHQARQAARVERDRAADVAAAQQRLAWADDDRRGLLTYLADDAPRWDFSADMLRAFEQYGELTPRQESAAWRGLDRMLERAARDAARPAESAGPTGTQQVRGEVLSTRIDEGYAGKSVKKMLVLDDRGFRVWGTCPAALAYGEDGFRFPQLRGRRVQFTANLTAKQGSTDLTFLIAKNPRDAVLLPPA